MAKSRGRKFAEITSPTSGVFDLTSVPTITNAKLQNSAMTLAGSSVSLGGTGVANTDALSEGSSNLYFTDARVQTFLGGGTLAGNIVVPDNRSIYVGSQSDFRIIHNTINTQLVNATGALQITSNGGFDVTGAATFSSTITATGNITGTLATAAQPNITSLGTLSSLSVGAITSTGKLSLNDSTYGGWIQSNTSVRIDIDNDNNQTDRAFVVSKNNGATSLLTILENTAATFAGSITATGLIVNANTLTLNGTDPLINLQNGGSNHWQIGFENTQSDRFVIYDNNASS